MNKNKAISESISYEIESITCQYSTHRVVTGHIIAKEVDKDKEMRDTLRIEFTDIEGNKCSVLAEIFDDGVYIEVEHISIVEVFLEEDNTISLAKFFSDWLKARKDNN